MNPEMPAVTEGPPVPANDSVGRGCLFGCLCQVAFFALGFLVAMTLKGRSGDALIVIWGATQWIGLIPLILHQKKQRHRRTVQGLIVTGALGVLLSSACAAMIFGR